MKKLVGPVVLVTALAAAVVTMRYLMWRETQEPEMVDANPAMRRLAEAKKATKQPGRTAVIETSKGIIKFVLYEKDAPVSTRNFVKLIQQRFYDGSSFHRVLPELIQAGLPGDPKKRLEPIELEIVAGLTHEEGVVGMARTDDPNSANCQFYITRIPCPQLDGNYAVFGKVTEGMDVVKQIKLGDKIKSIRIVTTPAVQPPKETKPVGRDKPK